MQTFINFINQRAEQIDSARLIFFNRVAVYFANDVKLFRQLALDGENRLRSRIAPVAVFTPGVRRSRSDRFPLDVSRRLRDSTPDECERH